MMPESGERNDFKLAVMRLSFYCKTCGTQQSKTIICPKCKDEAVPHWDTNIWDEGVYWRWFHDRDGNTKTV
jgi:predicted Zn-ribbon and HTH transcriptional regulator